MRRLPLGFTGSADELRRHSRRDLLVNIVLGGLYTSVARRNLAQYLASRTTIDGTPLALVPPARSRWPAIVLVLAFVAFRLADEFGHGPPLPWLVACATLLLPYVWTVGAQRSIDAIAWRGMRLAFRARWSEVYLASWPVFVLGFAWAVAQPRVAALAEHAALAPRPLALATAAAALVALPLLAVLAFNLRRLRFTRTRVDGIEPTWPARLPAYLRVCFVAALALAATAILPVLALRYALLGTLAPRGMTAETLVVYAFAFTAIVLLSAPARAWYEAEIFALTWNGLRVGDHLRVDCQLDARAYARMKTAQTWRTFFTFGAHRAHAIVRAHEAKLAALAIWEA